jgi:hypothetical protein
MKKISWCKQKSITSIMLTATALLFSLNAFAANNLKEMFNESTVEGQLIYRYQNLEIAEGIKDGSDSAVGGMLSVNTGSLHGISLGVTFGTANDMFSNDNDGAYGLLQEDHEGYATLKEYYVQGEWLKTAIKYGAQHINTPWANGDEYPWFLPITYRGLSVINRGLSNTEIHGYYLTDISTPNSDEFVDISKNVNSGADSNPLIIGGIKYALDSESYIFNAQGWGYHVDDFIDMSYVDLNVGKKFGPWTAYIKPSYLAQKSAGDEIRGDFDTYQYGVMAGTEAYGFNASLHYSETGDDNLFRGWGHSSVVPAQFLVSERAKETAYMAYAGYAFDAIGIPGLYAAITYASFDTPDSGTNSSSDADEIDYNVMYDFNDNILGGALSGLHLEVRYADINFDSDPDMTELHVLAIYSFSFGGEK